MGILGSFIGQAAWGSAQYLAQNAAVHAAYKGLDSYKNRGARPLIYPEHVYDHNGTPIPFGAIRIFGTPGASLETAHDLDANARSAGISGELRVAEELDRLSRFYPNMYVFHSVKLPDRTGDIDHLVIQGDKMMVIDSKNWKGDAEYHLFDSNEVGDTIARDGQNFLGGRISLQRQMYEWDAAFTAANLQICGMLVVANRKSTTVKSVATPYWFNNIDGMEGAFASFFYQDPDVPPMNRDLLNYTLSMVQDLGALRPVVAPIGGRATSAGTKWLIAWSVFNWTVLWLLAPLAGLSAIPLVIATHIHKKKVKRAGLGGEGLLATVLVFTYIQLVAWAVLVALNIWGAAFNL